MKKALLSLHVAIILAGFTGVLGRLITLNEGLLVWWRMFITVVCLWVLFYFLKRIRAIALKDFFKIDRASKMVSSLTSEAIASFCIIDLAVFESSLHSDA